MSMATTRSAARSLRNQINSQRATSSLSTRAIPSCAPSPRQAFAPSSSRYLSSSSCYSAQPAAARRAPSSSTVQHGRHTTTLNRPQSMHGSSTRNMLLALSLAGSAIFWLSCTDATSPIRNDARSPAPNDTTSSISTLHGGHEFLGIHLWGSNRHKIVSPEPANAGQQQVKKPKYLNALSGQAFRDLKLHEQYAVAVTSSGDLIQWGTGYCPSSDIELPTTTLRGQNIVQVALTANKIYARTKSGDVLIVPASRQAQLDTTRRPLPTISPLWRLLGYSNPGVQYVKMTMSQNNAGKESKVADISAGRSHLLALSVDGKALCAAVDENCNEMGQMGGGTKLLADISSLSRQDVDKKDGAQELIRGNSIEFDTTLKEIPALRSISCKQLVAGDRHSLALTSEGRVLAWGNNTMGQLALGASFAFPTIPTPTEANLYSAYPRTSKVVCKALYAGGDTSYFLVEREDMKNSLVAGTGNERLDSMIENHQGALIYNDVLSCGNGMYGAIGNGQYLSIGQPTKVKSISGLTEYSESAGALRAIPIKDLSISSTHTAVVLENAVNDMVGSQVINNFGNDVYLFGHNDNYQLGTGKRSNLSIPQHVSPLPYAALVPKDVKAKKAAAEFREEGKLESGSLTHMPHNRLQLAPRKKGVEERIVCGYGTTAVYWHTEA